MKGSLSRLFSNLDASKQSIYDIAKGVGGAIADLPLTGVPNKTRDIAKDFGKSSKAFKDAGSLGENTRYLKDAGKELNKKIDSIARLNEMSADDVSKSILSDNLSGLKTDDIFGGEKDMITKDNIQSMYKDIDKRYGKQAEALGSMITTPFKTAGSFFADSSPAGAYTKGALGITAMQYMNGSRDSLTSQNGQKDIAGVPFI